MKRDLFISYECTPVEDVDVAGLAKLGITIKPATGTCCVFPDDDNQWWKEVGAVVVWDDTRNIDCLPYKHITTQDRGFLAAVGWAAWLNPPTAERQWAHSVSKDGRGYWHQIIYAEVIDNDRGCQRVIAAATTHRQRNDRLLGFDAA